MNRLSEKACMLLKDTNNFYLWMPSLATGQPSTLLGRPIVSCPDMPNIASSAYAVGFGDFSKAYTIVDRIQTEVQRLTELYAESGQVGVIVRRRVGGQVTLAEAIRVLQIQS
jgi:HK97 family phage major capsid protein